MPRIFHILAQPEPLAQSSNAGAASSNAGAARWLANVVKSDDNTVVLTPSFEACPEVDPSRVRIVKGLLAYKSFYEGGGYLLPWKLVTTVLQRVLTSALQDLEPGDTVWIHDRPEFAAALSSLVRLRGAWLFLHLHNTQLMRCYEGLLYGLKADCFVFNSQLAEGEFQMRFPRNSRTVVVSSGLNPTLFHPAARLAKTANCDGLPAEPLMIVFSARLAPRHEVKTFLDAMKMMQDRRIPVRGVVVCQSADRGDLADLRLSAPSNVSIEAYTTPNVMARLLRKADLFCIPSCWRSPATQHMIEALACGLPVVVMDNVGHPGITEAPGVLLVPGTPDSLVQTFAELAAHPNQRQQLARLAVETYAQQFMWSATRSGYRSVLAANFVPQTNFDLVPSLLHALAE